MLAPEMGRRGRAIRAGMGRRECYQYIVAAPLLDAGGITGWWLSYGGFLSVRPHPTNSLMIPYCCSSVFVFPHLLQASKVGLIIRGGNEHRELTSTSVDVRCATPP